MAIRLNFVVGGFPDRVRFPLEACRSNQTNLHKENHWFPQIVVDNFGIIFLLCEFFNRVSLEGSPDGKTKNGMVSSWGLGTGGRMAHGRGSPRKLSNLSHFLKFQQRIRSELPWPC